MEKYYKEEIMKEEESYLLIPIFETHPSLTELRHSFSGEIWIYGELKDFTTFTSASAYYTSVIELNEAEIDEALKHPFFLEELLEEKGLPEEETRKISQLITEYIGEEAEERELKLPDEVKKAIANIMALIAIKLLNIEI